MTPSLFHYAPSTGPVRGSRPTVSRVSAVPIEGQPIERASTLELFLDLVFVFTVTQLTELVSHPHGVRDYAQAALLLAMTFWMYDGYVWLTGNVRLDRSGPRLAIFAGMSGFLLMALAIPGAFGATAAAGDSGIAFGLGFLLVTVVHFGLFVTAPNSSAQAIRRIAPFNFVGALLVLGAGLVAQEWRWVGWLAAVLVVTSSTFLGRDRGWNVSSAHFVERHGLVIIVALGESVVAIGVGAGGLDIDAGLAATAILALALSGTLWWVYFDRDDEHAARAMTAADVDRRGRLGMWVAYTHYAMIAGIVVAAAGIKLIVAHPTEPAGTAAAWNLAAGVGIYLLGETVFRYRLGIGTSAKRLVVAALALVTVPLGIEVSGVAQLTAVVAVMAILVASMRLTPDADRPLRAPAEPGAR